MPIHTAATNANCLEPTLYEVILAEVLHIYMLDIAARERVTSNLSNLATRALFSATNELTNAELLRILHPGTLNASVGTDTREARNLRSIGSERTLKIGTILSNCISLLSSRAVPKSEVVRSWTYSVIHEAARQVVSDARKSNNAFRDGEVGITPGMGDQMLNDCIQLVSAMLNEKFKEATSAALLDRPAAEERRFLHYASSLVIDEMDRRVSPLLSLHNLVEKTFPAIEDYDFEAKEA